MLQTPSEMEKLIRHKQYGFSSTLSRDEDASMVIHTLCSKVEKLSARVNDRMKNLQRSHLSWRKTEIRVIQRLVQDLCKRARGIEGSQKVKENLVPNVVISFSNLFPKYLPLVTKRKKNLKKKEMPFKNCRFAKWKFS